MTMVWTKSNTPLSYLIRAVTGEPVSHFAFVFNSPGGGLMFESNLLGTHPKFFKTAQKHCTIVQKIELPPLPTELEDQVWDEVVSKYDGKGYDFAGAIYLGLMILRERIFKIPRPKKNAWSKPDTYFCNELYAALSLIPSLPSIPVSDGMETPWQVYLKVMETLIECRKT